MKKLIISEEEKKRILLLYEQSQFVKDMARTFGTSPESFLPLDWSLYKADDPKRAELSKDFSQVKTAFSTFTNNAYQKKSDLSSTLRYLQTYSNPMTTQQKQWKDGAATTIQQLQTAISNASKQSTTTTTTPEQ